MTDARRTSTSLFSSRAGRVARDVLAALLALAFLGVILFLAAMLTAAFLVVAGLALLAGGAYWMWRKLRGSKSSGDPSILVATRGPDGWTVEGIDPQGR
ncbi:hypothetical protein [Maricaulis sp. CAU 1757]